MIEFSAPVYSPLRPNVLPTNQLAVSQVADL